MVVVVQLFCMGCLFSRRGGSEDGSELTSPGSGKNHRLLKEIPLWKSEVPITLGQLMSKRDEFWDTAPAFEGRREIWDALRVAVSAFETKDYPLAQAIVDGASITLPYGSLADCYDELGNRYQIPIYMLAHPINFLDESPDAVGKNDANESSAGLSDKESKKPTVARDFHIRISTMDDEKTISLTNKSTVNEGKLLVEEKFDTPACLQRWFFGGKVLLDRSVISSHKIPDDHVIQIIRKYSKAEIEKMAAEDLKESGTELDETSHVISAETNSTSTRIEQEVSHTTSKPLQDAVKQNSPLQIQEKTMDLSSGDQIPSTVTINSSHNCDQSALTNGDSHLLVEESKLDDTCTKDNPVQNLEKSAPECSPTPREPGDIRVIAEVTNLHNPVSS